MTLTHASLQRENLSEKRLLNLHRLLPNSDQPQAQTRHNLQTLRAENSRKPSIPLSAKPYKPYKHYKPYEPYTPFNL